MKTAKRRLFVIGAGGHGKVVIDAILSSGGYEIAGILDDDEHKKRDLILGIPVVGSTPLLSTVAAEYHVDAVALAIGDNYIREKLFRETTSAGLEVLSVIHPTACISRFATVEKGVVILARAVINPGSVIENNVCINTSASIDHDNHLEYSCHIFPNATLAGEVHVGAFSYVGSGAVVIPKRQIGRCAYIGAGAVVIKDINEGTKVAGVPAREIGCQSGRPLHWQ